MNSMRIKLLLKHRPTQPEPDFEYKPGWIFTRDPDCRAYDWLIAFEDTPKGAGERLACPRERTIFLTWEPTSVKRYSPAFTRQFGHFLTNRPPEADRHPHYHFGQGYFPWFIERSYHDVATATLPPKTKILSTVCSSKMMTQTRHHDRFVFTSTLAEEFPELDWYGRGVKPIERKIDALDAYRYHLAIENHIAPGHWTEKLSDPILCECLTFYAGDPEIARTLPADAIIPVPLDDVETAKKIIRAAIDNNEYEKRLPAIREAKRLLLERYNFHAQIIRVIESCADQPVTPVRPDHPVVVYSRKTLRYRNPLVGLSDGWHHFLNYLKGGR